MAANERKYQEGVERYLARDLGCITVRELRLGGPKLDVVGFAPESGEFHVVECKRTRKTVGIGQTFGQVLAYQSIIHADGLQFLTEFQERAQGDPSLTRQMTQYYQSKKIPINFYVALGEEACANPKLIKHMKDQIRAVGIIRVKSNFRCRNYIRDESGKNYDVCIPKTVEVPFNRPPRAALQRVLDHKNSNSNIQYIARLIDEDIRELNDQIKTHTIGKNKPSEMRYRLRTIFLRLRPRKKWLAIELSKGGKSEKCKLDKEEDIPNLISKVKDAVNFHLGKT
jgi:hypothetical protein